MAWEVDGYNLKMAEGDYGMSLPVTISGITLTANDHIRITILAAQNGETVMEKDYSNIQDNTFSLVFTEQESAALRPKSYVYRMDIYQGGSFLCNVIPVANFKVVDTA